MATNVINCVVGGAEYAEASDAILLPLHKLDHTLVYNADSTLSYVQVTYSANTYRLSLTYLAGQVTAISGWVKQ